MSLFGSGAKPNDNLSEREWQTRKQRIDSRLVALGWKIVHYKLGMDTPGLDGYALEEYPTASGPADYALFVKGQCIGIIEAKKVGVGPANVLEQAKRYSRGARDGIGQWGEYRVPLLYATNGEQIHFIDVRQPQAYSRTLATFHTPGALFEIMDRHLDSGWFTRNPVAIPGLRYYQKDALTAVEGGVAAGKRSMLVAMATGTGKTFTTVAQIHRLLESKAARRILFLVDRRALAAQAVREFNQFQTPRGNKFNQEYEVYHQHFRREDFGDGEDGVPFDPKVLPAAYLTAPDASHTFVYVCTIQRLAINLLGQQAVFAGADLDSEDDADKLDIPIHAFDVVIADECHRGYTAQEASTWRSVLDHFDAVRIGLTATPAAHTLAAFKEVIYRYSTEQAIDDGFLVDYDAVKISSQVKMNGVFLKEGEQVVLRDQDTGQEMLDHLEDERQFSSSEIEARITVPESNRRIIKEIASHARAHEKTYGRFPKMLIFASNDLPHVSHADQLVRICREEFGQGDAFVQKITGSPNVDRPLQRIREFRNRPEPGIVVTVDMLATGVDIPALEYIVFLRPVKSRILWVQMLGRGTRLCPEINKGRFTIFDCFDGTLIEYFKNATDFEVEPRVTSTPLPQVIENIYGNVDRDYNVKALTRRLHRISREMSGEGYAKFAAHGILDGDLDRFANELASRLKSDFTGTMALLRDPLFQDLLQNYPRPKRQFWVAPEHSDAVVSEVMFRAGSTLLKPEDYLEAFARFVRENPEHIEAISILLNRPKSWNPHALEELTSNLQRHSFAETELRKAHQRVTGKALADIISMVKHAAREEEPLLTAAERVQRAIEKVSDGQSFTPEQTVWLERIRSHLVENLSIEMEDFDNFPIFADRGGRLKALLTFPPPLLQRLIGELNFAVAA